MPRVDQAIYMKVLDTMFKMEEKDLKYSRKLSQVCVLASYLHATECVIIELLSVAGLGGKVELRRI